MVVHQVRLISQPLERKINLLNLQAPGLEKTAEVSWFHFITSRRLLMGGPPGGSLWFLSRGLGLQM